MARTGINGDWTQVGTVTTVSGITFLGEYQDYATLQASVPGSGSAKWAYIIDSTWVAFPPKLSGMYYDNPATGGWERKGAYSDFFSDNRAVWYDDGDDTKRARLELSGITPGQESVLTVPDGDGTLLLAEGLAGGQTLIGGTGTNDTLVLNANPTETANITLGPANAITFNDSYVYIGNSLDGYPILSIDGYSNTDWQSPFITANRGRGTSGTPLDVLVDDSLCTIESKGYNDTDFRKSLVFGARVDELAANQAYGRFHVDTWNGASYDETFNVSRSKSIFIGLTDNNLLYVDRTNDMVGVGLNNPARKLHVNGEIRTDAIEIINGDTGGVQIINAAGTNAASVLYVSNADNLYLGSYSEFGSILFRIGDSADSCIRFQQADGFTFNTQNNTAYDFNMKGLTDDNLFYADSSTDKIGIGTDTPANKLHVLTSDTDTVTFENTNAGFSVFNIKAAANAQNFIRFYLNGLNPWIIGSDGGDSNKLKIENNTIFSTPVMTIDRATGNFGIGASDIAGAKVRILDGTNPQLRLTNTDGVDYCDFEVDATGDLEITPTGGDVSIITADLRLDNNKRIEMKDSLGDYKTFFLLQNTDRFYIGDYGAAAPSASIESIFFRLGNGNDNEVKFQYNQGYEFNNNEVDQDFIMNGIAKNGFIFNAGADTFTHYSDTYVNGSDLIMPKTSGKGIKVDNTTPTFGWRDIIGQLNDRTAGASGPVWSTYRGNINAWKFPTASGSKNMYIDFHMPHDYVPGSDIYIHIHWSQNVVDTGGAAAAPGNVKWYFDVTYADGHGTPGGAADPFIAEINTNVVQQGSTTQYGHMIAEVQLSAASPSASQLDSDTLQVDGLLLVRVHRDSNDAADTLDQSPFIHFIDIHYQSTNMATKQKAPDFYT
jgi:hypothetical protein